MRYVLKLLKLSLEHKYEWNSNTAEAAIGDVLQEKMLLEILQNSQENTCAGVSFLIMLKARPEVEVQSEKSHHEKEPPPPFPFN